MARFDFLKVYNTMEQQGLVAVFYHSDIDVACNVLKACYEGGVRLFEFTNRGDFAHEIFAQLSKWAATECPDMIMGAGSVVDAPTAVMYLQSGANFVVGPVFVGEVATACNRRNVPYMPGCATATEIITAHEAGCHVVKVFPGGNVGGPSFVKNVKAPMPWSKIMVTGGVEPTAENISAWFSAGATAVGMGSNLFPKDVIARRDWATITRLCAESVAIIASLKH
jgi:2-dehydro-3-deoxyphosphogluconate aldolase/(4S)-4-hydroxy-2-oxoglutarate aldolase